jgi:hypothetical protein
MPRKSEFAADVNRVGADGRWAAPPGLQPELRFLSWLCSVGLANSAARPLDVPDDFDWQRFSRLARRHCVVPVVWNNLQARSQIKVPLAVLADLRDGYRKNALRALRLVTHVTQITAALNSAGIRSVPLKGVCLAARHYGDVGGRHAGDVDLLIAHEHVTKADTILRERGYLRISNTTHVAMDEPFSEDMIYRLHFMYISPGGVVVELHFRLHKNPDVLPLNISEILAESIPTRLGNVTLPTMPDALQFVFLATHGARHEWVRMQWVCDIATMVDRAATDEIRRWLAMAKHFGLTNPVAQALIIANRFLGINVPSEISAAYQRSWRVRYMVRRAEQSLLTDLYEPSAEDPSPSFKPGRRLYRMCVTSRPGYLLAELKDGLKALSARLAKPAPNLS